LSFGTYVKEEDVLARVLSILRPRHSHATNQVEDEPQSVGNRLSAMKGKREHDDSSRAASKGRAWVGCARK